jgi:hypothetical protein
VVWRWGQPSQPLVAREALCAQAVYPSLCPGPHVESQRRCRPEGGDGAPDSRGCPGDPGAPRGMRVSPQACAGRALAYAVRCVRGGQALVARGPAGCEAALDPARPLGGGGRHALGRPQPARQASDPGASGPRRGGHTPGGKAPGVCHRGWDAVRAFYGKFFRGFPDMRFDIKPLHVGEDAIPVELVLSGTHCGMWCGMPPTERHCEIPAWAVFIFDKDEDCRGARLHRLGPHAASTRSATTGQLRLGAVSDDFPAKPERMLPHGQTI